jgi:hypothetical protein
MTRIEPHMKASLKDHVLVWLDAGKDVKAAYLKKPGEGRMMSCLITFTPEGIVIQGDLTPGRLGNVSMQGYGLEWFAGPLSEDYLCEKFLEKRFSKERTVEAIKETIISRRREGKIHREFARELWDGIPGGDEADASDFYYFITMDLGGDSEDMRQDYDPAEAGWLCAIQKRFSDLYNE